MKKWILSLALIALGPTAFAETQAPTRKIHLICGKAEVGIVLAGNVGYCFVRETGDRFAFAGVNGSFGANVDALFLTLLLPEEPQRLEGTYWLLGGGASALGGGGYYQIKTATEAGGFPLDNPDVGGYVYSVRAGINVDAFGLGIHFFSGSLKL